MISLGLCSEPPGRKRRRDRLYAGYGIPAAAFVLSIPAVLVSLPRPHAAEDYLVAGCSATLIAMIAALFVITRRQMRAFERSMALGAGERLTQSGVSGRVSEPTRSARVGY
jgi:hypothetical protein